MNSMSKLVRVVFLLFFVDAREGFAKGTYTLVQTYITPYCSLQYNTVPLGHNSSSFKK